MTVIPPGRENGNPQDRPERDRGPDAVGGPRPTPDRPPNRDRPAQSRSHEDRAGVDPAAPAAANEIELPSAPLAVPYRRTFMANGLEWVGWVSGRGAYGTGHTGLGTVQTLHFALVSDPDKPVREILMATGRFEDLFEEELLRLHAASREIPVAEPGAGRQRVRRRGEGLL